MFEIRRKLTGKQKVAWATIAAHQKGKLLDGMTTLETKMSIMLSAEMLSTDIDRTHYDRFP